MSDQKVVKITFEYADGHIEYLEQPDVYKWLDVVNNALVMEQIRGETVNLPTFKTGSIASENKQN